MVTVVNGVNNHQVGPIFDFCLANHDKMGGPAFQPVSFTGRDEEVSDEARLRQRYTTSHLAHDLARYYDGKIDPYRDWYPLGSATALAALADHMKGPEADFGQLSCGCHPNCGAATMMVANSSTEQWATVMSFFDLERFFRDLDVIVDSARGKTLTVTQLGLSFLRNFDEKKAPAGLTPLKMLELFDGKMGGGVAGGSEKKKSDWRITSILSMWFQDLWNYDFRRTEMCVIPYGTQEGEISFCAYNTGVGWRNIIEEMRQVASTQDWFAQKGRHPIYAGNRRSRCRRPSSARSRSSLSRAAMGTGTATTTPTPGPRSRRAAAPAAAARQVSQEVLRRRSRSRPAVTARVRYPTGALAHPRLLKTRTLATSPSSWSPSREGSVRAAGSPPADSGSSGKGRRGPCRGCRWRERARGRPSASPSGRARGGACPARGAGPRGGSRARSW